MKRIAFVFSLIILGGFFVALGQTLAAGGGGGGGGGTVCTEDVWACGDWNICSADGKQTRTCTMTFDCPFVTTPKPFEQQSCTPLCTQDVWTCGEWGACGATRVHTRTCTLTSHCANASNPRPAEQESCTPPSPPPTPTPAIVQPAPTTPAPIPTPIVATPPKSPLVPAPKISPKPACTRDIWQCEAWPACDKDGNQIRHCTQTFHCPTAHTTVPVQVQRCATLQCGNKPALRDRIFCRLELTPAGIARELELQYLPEECRAIKNRAGKKICVAKYKSLKSCFDIPVGDARTACARRALGLGATSKEDDGLCAAKIGSKKTACQAAVRDKIYSLTKFGMYDREDQAEDALMKGADLNATADFVTLVENKKQFFNTVKTDSAREKIVREVDEAWKKFVKQIPAPGKEN